MRETYNFVVIEQTANCLCTTCSNVQPSSGLNSRTQVMTMPSGTGNVMYLENLDTCIYGFDTSHCNRATGMGWPHIPTSIHIKLKQQHSINSVNNVTFKTYFIHYIIDFWIASTSKKAYTSECRWLSLATG